MTVFFALSFLLQVSGLSWPFPDWQIQCHFGQTCGDLQHYAGVLGNGTGKLQAPCAGQIKAVGEQQEYGVFIILQCADTKDLFTLIMGSRGLRPCVSTGDRVKRGAEIGYARGAFHLGVRPGEYNSFVYPGCRDKNWNELWSYSVAASSCTKRFLGDMIDPETLWR